MNNWMSDPFEYPDTPISQGKVLDKIALEDFFEKHGEWGRYKDYDGDGIGYRTIPGTDHPRAAYFHTRHRPQRYGRSTANAARLAAQYGTPASQV
jgi:hypothetical protein